MQKGLRNKGVLDGYPIGEKLESYLQYGFQFYCGESSSLQCRSCVEDNSHRDEINLFS